MIVNADNLILGRMATTVVKKALNGEQIDVVNCERAILTGKKKDVLAKYKQRVNRGGPFHGPFYPRMPDRFVRRAIRGMLNYKQERGKNAFKRIKGSVELLNGKFPTYYRESISSGNPNVIAENFILDVSNQGGADARLTREFRLIIQHMQRVSNQTGKSKDPMVKKLFEMLNQNFKAMESNATAESKSGTAVAATEGVEVAVAERDDNTEVTEQSATEVTEVITVEGDGEVIESKQSGSKSKRKNKNKKNK